MDATSLLVGLAGRKSVKVRFSSSANVSMRVILVMILFSDANNSHFIKVLGEGVKGDAELWENVSWTSGEVKRGACISLGIIGMISSSFSAIISDSIGIVDALNKKYKIHINPKILTCNLIYYAITIHVFWLISWHLIRKEFVKANQMIEKWSGCLTRTRLK